MKKNIEKIIRLCMICDNVKDGDEWVRRNVFEEIHKNDNTTYHYSHGVCDNQTCQDVFMSSYGEMYDQLELFKKR